MRPYGATLLRMVVGAILLVHGYHGYFLLETEEPIDLPAAMAGPVGSALTWYLVAAHVVGGLMMIAGLWTRWAALANVPILLASVVFQHAKHGFFLTALVADRAAGSTRVVGLEYPLVMLGATLAIVLLGGGALAMTHDR